MNTGRIRAAALVSLALVLPVLAGCSAGTDVRTASVGASSAPRPTPSETVAPPASEVPDIDVADASLESLAPVIAVTPVRIAMPGLSIDMAVEAEGLDDEGAMALPDNAATAGWYRFGPGLREPAGATVIAAHIDSRHDGIGPFSRLKDAAIGSVVSVTADDGIVVNYSVTDVRAVGKIDAPMAEVFDRAGAPRLTLVTCGGAFDSGTGHYVDNVIVTAVPIA